MPNYQLDLTLWDEDYLESDSNTPTDECTISTVLYHKKDMTKEEFKKIVDNFANAIYYTAVEKRDRSLVKWYGIDVSLDSPDFYNRVIEELTRDGGFTVIEDKTDIKVSANLEEIVRIPLELVMEAKKIGEQFREEDYKKAGIKQ